MTRAEPESFFSEPARITAVLLSVLAIALPQAVLSQDPAADAPVEAPTSTTTSSDTTTLDTIEVTGSRIKRVDMEGAAPVVVISREDIANQGYTTVTDVLNNISQNSGGTFGPSQSFSFARGSQSIDLRGFGAGRTLVLLDGRRLPVFPQGLGGTSAFVDLSTIPAGIIERVEILTAGASAIYGSDAVSGVVNIITRKNITETVLGVRASGTDAGGAAEQRYTLTSGFTAQGTDIQVIGEYRSQDALYFRQRSYSSSDFNFGGLGSSFGSGFVTDSDADGIFGGTAAERFADPACGTSADSLGGLGVPSPGNRCRFDRSAQRMWLPESERGSFAAKLTRDLGATKLGGRFSYYEANQRYELEPNPFSGGESSAFTGNRIIPDSAFDPTYGPGYVQPGATNNPTGTDGGFFFRRLTEFGNRGADLKTQALAGMVTLSGFAWNDYNWEVGLTRNEIKFNSLTPTVLSSVLDDYVSNRGLDLFQVIPANVVAAAKHIQAGTATSRNTLLDATVAGPIGYSMPDGPVQFAVHTDVEGQEYEDTFDAVTLNGDVFDGGTSGGGERSYAGLGAEFSLPVLKMLLVNVAGRYDRYFDDSQVKGAFSPSASIELRPLDSLLVRASTGRSFRAPDLQRLYGAATAGFSTVVDTPACLAAGGTPGELNPRPECQEIQSVPTVAGSNPNLSEERGRNVNFGASWEIVDDLNVTADYFKIKLEDIVADLSAQDILDNCGFFGTNCGQIQYDPISGTLGDPNSGGSSNALISAVAQNLSSREVEGIDVSAAYGFGLLGAGQIRTELQWSHLLSYLQQTDSTSENQEQLNLAQIPEDRGSWTTDWIWRMVGLTIRADVVGKYPGQQAGTTVDEEEYIGTYTTWNTQARVDLAGFGLIRLGVDNVFDKDFPLDPTYLPGTPNVMNQFVTSGTLFYHNALGRQGYLQYEYRF